MKANEPKTYQGIINKKRCYEIAKHYSISENVFNLILDFMNENPEGKVECGSKYITLMKNGQVVKYIEASCKTSSQTDGIKWHGNKFVIIPHIVVTYSSGGGSSGGGWSSGGGSSNNNNNNNNNNR